MSTSFLRTLPREIRDLIYTYILAGPDGTITLSPWSIEIVRSLSILRTCKQIHRECKDIIWEHKGLSLREFPRLGSKLGNIHFRPDQIARWHLLLQLEVLDWDELEWVERSLAASMRGYSPGLLHRLHGITIKTSKERPQTKAEFEDILDLRENGEIVDGRLFRDYMLKSHSSVVRRREPWTWVMNTSWPRLSPWGKRKWLAEMLIHAADTGKLLHKIHKRFGGEMYIDGLLCLREGKQVVENLRLDPRDGEITIIPRR